MTKTQIDRLGERLKKGNISDDDLRLLDQLSPVVCCGVRAPAIKYGGGSAYAQGLLNDASKLVKSEESNESGIANILALSLATGALPEEIQRDIDDLQQAQVSIRQELLSLLRRLLESVRG
jgi:hypothetical protein